MNPYGIDNGPIETRKIRPRNRREDPLATTEYNGHWYSAEEVAELERRFEAGQEEYRRECRRKWEETKQGQLCLKFYEAFQEYKKFLLENEYAIRTPCGWRVDYDEHNLFEEALRLVENHRREREETARKTWRKHSAQHGASIHI